MKRVESLKERIAEWKSRRNAILLVHNYQLPEVQDVADYVGDSLELSRKAAASRAEVIVFCGVHFMAETASILCPDGTVLLPDPRSDCPMARMITAPRLRELKRRHPGAVVVCYVNSTADVKAESDLCCTSANAQEVVESIPPDREIIFVPDKYLGAYTAARTGRELVLWEGYCPTHACITPQDIERARAEHPGAAVMVHPECLPEVCALADVVASTSGMCRFARESHACEFVVGTEVGLLHRLRKENPDKLFWPASEAAVCANMKRNTLEKVLWALESMEHEVRVEPQVRERAMSAIEAMVSAGASAGGRHPGA